MNINDRILNNTTSYTNSIINDLNAFFLFDERNVHTDHNNPSDLLLLKYLWKLNNIGSEKSSEIHMTIQQKSLRAKINKKWICSSAVILVEDHWMIYEGKISFENYRSGSWSLDLMNIHKQLMFVVMNIYMYFMLIMLMFIHS